MGAGRVRARRGSMTFDSRKLAAPRPPVDRFTDHELAAQGLPRRAVLPDPAAAVPLRLADRRGLRPALARPEPRIGAAELEEWRHRQQHRAADGSDNVRGLVFTTRTGRPIDQRNVGRALQRARTAAGVDHGSLKTFHSTVASQLADAGLHPSKTRAFLGHAHVTTTPT